MSKSAGRKGFFWEWFLPISNIILGFTVLGFVGNDLYRLYNPEQKEVNVCFVSNYSSSALHKGEDINAIVALTYSDFKKFTKKPFEGVVIALQNIDPVHDATFKRKMTEAGLHWESPASPGFYVWNPIEKRGEYCSSMREAYDFYKKVLVAKCGGVQ